MKNTRLFWQVFISVLFIILISIAATTWFGTRTIQSFYYAQMREDIKERALLLRPHILQLLATDRQGLQQFCRLNGRAAGTRITVIQGDGTVLADSNESPARMDNHGTRPEIRVALQGSTGSSFRLSKTLQRTMLYVAIPLAEKNHAQGVLRLSVPATALRSVLTGIYNKIVFGVCLIGVLAALLSYRLARRISKPLEEMRRGAERLAAGNTDKPLSMQHAGFSKETSELARSLNDMAAQIDTRLKTIIEQRNELEAVFSSMTDAVIAIGGDNRIIRINRSAAELFEIDGEAVQGEFVDGVLRNMVLQNFISRALANSSPLEEHLLLTLDGREISLKSRSVPLTDSEENRIGILLVMNNRTRLNQLENIRQDFVANVSHELKTPITAIRGYVETLLDGAWEDPEDARKFLEIIDRQGSRLDAIVDDLLSLARIEDRKANDDLALKKERIQPLLESAVQACSILAEQKDIAVKLSCAPEIMATVNRIMLEQAIINLLTNGITYSPEGTTVIVAASETMDDRGKLLLRIEVRDQGPGIAPQHLERIFERFYRCDKARSRQKGGTGLGLSIVKHIVQCHGGRVEVQSKLGEGAAFFLILPVDGP